MPISCRMGRSVIGMCAGFGVLVGGFVPELWGASAWGLESLVFGALGGVAGIWAGLRIAE